MPAKKFEAFVEPGLCANVGRKRTLRSAAKAGKKSKSSADASSKPLGLISVGNRQVVSSRTRKASKGPAKKPTKDSVPTCIEPMSGGSSETTVSSGVRIEQIHDGPRTRSKRAAQNLDPCGVVSRSKTTKWGDGQTTPNAQVEDEIECRSPAVTRSRSRSNAVKDSPATKIGEIFNVAYEDIIGEVVAAIHLSECPKAMLTSKAWYKRISPRVMALEPGLRYRRWLAVEMKHRRANVGHALLERLGHDPKSANNGKLTFKMHWILIDWLVDVAIEFHLSNATLALTSSVLDRFLALQAIEKKELQLLGVTCMWIASKMEEVSVPLVSDFAWITYDTYTVDELRVMERRVLNALTFTVSRWIPLNYINLIKEIPEIMANEDLKHSISFVHELVLHNPEFMLNPPDFLAAAIAYCAMTYAAPTLHAKLVSEGAIEFMLNVSVYESQEMQHLIAKIHKLPAMAIEQMSKQHAVLTKYRRETCNNVASRFFGVPPPVAL